jgi:hypothetical protein
LENNKALALQREETYQLLSQQPSDTNLTIVATKIANTINNEQGSISIPWSNLDRYVQQAISNLGTIVNVEVANNS